MACVCDREGEQLCEWPDTELANTCNEGDKSGAKCFVQLQVRCELTQDGKRREGVKKKVDSIGRRETTLSFTAAFTW